MDKFQRGYRSLFWPIVLVGIGIIWLLGNLGMIPQQNFGSLIRLWPLLLVIIGLDLLFGRRSTLGSAVIGVVTVGAIIFFLIASPSWGLSQASTRNTLFFHEPVGEASSSIINLDLTSAKTDIYTLADSSDLINARIDTIGNADFNVSGDKNKTVNLRQNSLGADWFNPSNWFQDLRWDIGISPNVPISLNLNEASGSSSIDLSKLKLTSLTINGASGSNEITLPKSSDHYLVELRGASGSISIHVPCSDIEIRLEGASGSQTVDVPNDCPLRVDVRNTGSGSINLPSYLTQTNGSGGGRHRMEGVWESASIDTSKPFILVTITSAGSGSINIR